MTKGLGNRINLYRFPYKTNCAPELSQPMTHSTMSHINIRETYIIHENVHSQHTSVFMNYEAVLADSHIATVVTST